MQVIKKPTSSATTVLAVRGVALLLTIAAIFAASQAIAGLVIDFRASNTGADLLNGNGGDGGVGALTGATTVGTISGGGKAVALSPGATGRVGIEVWVQISGTDAIDNETTQTILFGGSAKLASGAAPASGGYFTDASTFNFHPTDFAGAAVLYAGGFSTGTTSSKTNVQPTGGTANNTFYGGLAGINEVGGIDNTSPTGWIQMRSTAALPALAASTTNSLRKAITGSNTVGATTNAAMDARFHWLNHTQNTYSLNTTGASPLAGAGYEFLLGTMSFNIVSAPAGVLNLNAVLRDASGGMTNVIDAVSKTGPISTFYNRGTDIVITTASAGPTNGQYTMTTAAGGVTSLLKGANTTFTASLTNSGTGAQDTLGYSALTATATNGTITGTAGTGSAIAQGATGSVVTLTFTGTSNGTSALTPTATVTNTAAAGTPANTPTNTTFNITVGNATANDVFTAVSGTPKTTFGTALTGTVNQANAWATNKISSTTTAGGNVLGNTATILDAVLTANRTVSMAWRTRVSGEAAVLSAGILQPIANGGNQSPALSSGSGAKYGVVSDVVQLNGTGGTLGTLLNKVQTDEFVLQMSVTDAAFGGIHAGIVDAIDRGFLYLGWLDTSGGAGNEKWMHATEGNIGGIAYQHSDKGFKSSYATYLAGHGGTLSATNLGDWGYEDLGAGLGANVWAVLNHNSIFAAIPEPSSFVLAGLGFIGLAGVARRRRNKLNIA